MDATELQKQLAELMKVVNNKRKLRQDAEKARTQAEAKLAEATAATAAAAGTKAQGPKLAIPDKFDGTRGVKAEVYGSQVGLYVVSNPTMFPDDLSKVVFALSYLTGLASKWAQPFTQRIFSGKPVGYNEFTVAFQAMYFDTEKETRAEKALRALKQTKSVAAYTHAFLVHAHNCGWEAPTLVSQYTQGLHKDIRLALVLALTTFETLTEVTQLALKIDNEINGADASQSTPVAPADPNAMDILAVNARLSESDRQQMMRQGLCFQCGEHSHILRECPLKGMSTGTGRTRCESTPWRRRLRSLQNA
jgi:hypothetical protein